MPGLWLTVLFVAPLGLTVVLSFAHAEIPQIGHAFQCRINCEDPDHNFRPSPGTITALRIPGGCGVRWDSHIQVGYTVPPNYDSLIGKLIVWDESREFALRRLKRALMELRLSGVKTTTPLHQALATDEEVRTANVHTRFLEQWLGPESPALS